MTSRDLDDLADRLVARLESRLETLVRKMLAAGKSAAGQGDSPWQSSEANESMDRTSTPRAADDGDSSFETQMEALRSRLKENGLTQKLLRGRRSGSKRRRAAP